MLLRVLACLRVTACVCRQSLQSYGGLSLGWRIPAREEYNAYRPFVEDSITVLLLICPCSSREGRAHKVVLINRGAVSFFKNNTSAVGMGISHWSIVGLCVCFILLCYVRSLIARFIIHHRASECINYLTRITLCIELDVSHKVGCGI